MSARQALDLAHAARMARQREALGARAQQAQGDGVDARLRCRCQSVEADAEYVLHMLVGKGCRRRAHVLQEALVGRHDTVIGQG